MRDFMFTPWNQAREFHRENNNMASSSSQDGFISGGPPVGSSQEEQAAQRRKSVPYIPSYMDLTNGPEPCVVCSDAATGYHYRCMTCEGCKGFFRRTIQKNLRYHCKWNKNCIIDKTTRNQCQECRFHKCIAVGMATDLVLNERQRVAKRKLIEDNRARRKSEHFDQPLESPEKPDNLPIPESMTDNDRSLIGNIITAYECTSAKITNGYSLPVCDRSDEKLRQADPELWQQLAEVMTPSIVKVVEFAKGVPGFIQLNVDDQILLLKSCCMEIMCLRAACRYDPDSQLLTLHNGLKLPKEQLLRGSLGVLVEPIFEFAVGLSKLALDSTELALLASVLLMQSDRSGLREPEAVEKIQDAILGAYKRYIAEKRPLQPVHWAKILMKVTDLRTISTRYAERVLCIRLDSSGEIPPLFLEMFNENSDSSSSSSSTSSWAGDRDDRSMYVESSGSGDRDDRPLYVESSRSAGDRDDRPLYVESSDRDDRPLYVESSSLAGDRDDRPLYVESSSFAGGHDDRPLYVESSSSASDRDDRPMYVE